MSFNTYNPRNFGRFCSSKPYEVGDELAPGGPVSIGRSIRDYINKQYQHNENQYEHPKEESWQPSPLMRLRQPLFETQSQEYRIPTMRDLDESAIEEEQFTLVQKVIQSTLDQDEFLPMEDLQQSTLEYEQLSPIRKLQQSTLQHEQISPLRQLRQFQNSSLLNFQESTVSQETTSAIPKLLQSTFQKEHISPIQRLQQTTFQQEQFSSLQKLPKSTIEQELRSTIQKLEQPTPQQNQLTSLHKLLQPTQDQTSSVHKLRQEQFSPMQSLHRKQFSLAQQVPQPTREAEQFLPIQQLRQPTFQQKDFLPLQQLQQQGVQQPARGLDETLPMEQLRQPKLRQPSPHREQIPPIKLLRRPSPQPRLLKKRQATPPPQPSPPPRKDLKENPSSGSQTSGDEIHAEKTEPVKKSSDKVMNESSIDNLVGVKLKKKLTKKEWRRRQNVHLRRILTPKNALIVLNEMLPGEKTIGQFKVEPAPPHPYYNAANAHSFCAELTVDGVSYKGYGHSKLAARNDVAEQVFRDLILKHMGKLQRRQEANPDGGEGPDDWEDEESGDEEDALPMIQLASFALHKLFAEWECDGHKVPQLKALAPPSASEECEAGGRGALPTNAGAMQPCMLLAHLRPELQYRELAAGRAALYTMAVDLDGRTYSGTAANKRDARKEAAREACCKHFGVKFTDRPPSKDSPAPAAPAALAAPADL